MAETRIEITNCVPSEKEAKVKRKVDTVKFKTKDTVAYKITGSGALDAPDPIIVGPDGTAGPYEVIGTSGDSYDYVVSGGKCPDVKHPFKPPVIIIDVG